jgi:dihydropteroate synthase
MLRKRYTWTLKNREIRLGERTLLMGVLNVTPDSFSDGGKHSQQEAAIARALEIEAQGADLIDIGGESTRPGSTRVSEAEEWRRLAPVLKGLREKLSIPVSVDTYKSSIAERALDLGVDIINDPSGLTFDPLLPKVVAGYKAGLIINHMRGTPETWAKLPSLREVMGTILKDLDASIHRARAAGMQRTSMMIDPGIGFGKRKEQNSEILARLPEMTQLNFPVMVGPSRKQFLQQSTDAGRLFGTAAAVAIAILNQAHVVRVHDVAELRIVVDVADSIAAAQPDE